MENYEIQIFTGRDQDILTEDIKKKFSDIFKLEFNTVWNTREDCIEYSILVVGKVK